MDPGRQIRDERVLNPLESGISRGKDFLRSLVGAVFGLLLFAIVAPGLFFMSEFQYTAETFESATQASLDVPANGYVSFWGKPEFIEPFYCKVGGGQCLYSHFQKQQIQEKTGIKCGDDLKNPEIHRLSPEKERCVKKRDRVNGRDVERTVCEECWNAQWQEWVTVEDVIERPAFKMGVNIINPSISTDYKGLQIQDKPEYKVGNDSFKEKEEYLAADVMILVVGEARDGDMASGNPFVISTSNYETTKEQIKKEQESKSFYMKVFGALAMLVGLLLVLAPVQAFINIAGSIPYLGDVFLGLSKITGAIMFASALGVTVILSIVYTIVFKSLRAFVDNIFTAVILGVVAALVVLVGLGFAFGKKRKKQEVKTISEVMKPTVSSQQTPDVAVEKTATETPGKKAEEKKPPEDDKDWDKPKLRRPEDNITHAVIPDKNKKVSVEDILESEASEDDLRKQMEAFIPTTPDKELKKMIIYVKYSRSPDMHTAQTYKKYFEAQGIKFELYDDELTALRSANIHNAAVIICDNDVNIKGDVLISKIKSRNPASNTMLISENVRQLSTIERGMVGADNFFNKSDVDNIVQSVMESLNALKD